MKRCMHISEIQVYHMCANEQTYIYLHINTYIRTAIFEYIYIYAKTLYTKNTNILTYIHCANCYPHDPAPRSSPRPPQAVQPRGHPPGKLPLYVDISGGPSCKIKPDHSISCHINSYQIKSFHIISYNLTLLRCPK